MGVDLILASLPFFKPNDVRRKYIEDKINSWPNAKIPQEVCDLLGFTNDAVVNHPTEAKQAWRDAAIETFDALMDSRQITSVSTHDGRDGAVFVTGGMSHGDTPSDYFDGFILLTYAVDEEMRDWAKQDCQPAPTTIS